MKCEKIFGRGACVPPLDRNARARLFVYLKAWSKQRREPGQHRSGPITDKHIEVLRVLLGCQNRKSGHCFPSHETMGLPHDLSKIVRQRLMHIPIAFQHDSERGF